MNKIFIVFSMIFLMSCDHFDEDKEVAAVQVKQDAKDVQGNVTTNSMRVADNVRDGIKRTGDQMREWWITPLPKDSKQPMPIRYCYRVLQDILCYRSQMPGWEGKLVGYQGDGAAPPTPATMKVMPLRADNPASLPANRAANTKPVFSSLPTDNKEGPASAEPVSIDSTHETLPDSPLSPQL